MWRSTEISGNLCGDTKRKDKFWRHCQSQVEFIPPLLSMARICQLSIKTPHSFSLRGILPLSARQTPALSALQCSLSYQLSGNTTHDAFRRVWHFLSMGLSSALCCSMTQQQKHALHVCLPLVLCSVFVFYFCIAIIVLWMNVCMHTCVNEGLCLYQWHRSAGLPFSQIFCLWDHDFNSYVIYKKFLPAWP